MMHRLLNVMVVEDDPTLRHLFAESLRDDPDINTHEMGTIEEAARASLAERQFVVLLDPGLSDSSGLEGLFILHQTAPGAVVVFITGSDELIQPAKDAGADAVIIKGSPESVGAGLIKAVRNAVIARDHKRQFAPLMERNKHVLEVLQRARGDSVILDGKAKGATP
jgi:DNA-binding NarL/FixJ family response regulator